MAHKYFNRNKPDDWNITDFLNECGVESFRDKIGCYLTSLESIMNAGEEDERYYRASLLYDQYKKGAQPDYSLSRKWKSKHEQVRPSVQLNNPIFTGNPLVGNAGNINGGTSINVSKRERIHGKSDCEQPKTKRTKKSISDYFPQLETQHEEKLEDSPPILVDHINNPFLEKDEIKSVVQEQISLRPSTPSPLSSQPELDLVSSDNHEPDSFSDNGLVNCPSIINDVMELQLGFLPRKESRWILNDIDVSEKWHMFKEKSLELANREGLLVESHTQQILSLSHVLLLKPKQHCPLMLEVFGEDLLEAMHRDIKKRFTKQGSEFDEETLIKIIRIVKRLQRDEISRKKAVSELQILEVDRSYGECAILKAIRNIIERVPRATLKSSIGEVELCTAYIDPILCPLFMDPDRGIFLRWPNKQSEESKARKKIGRAKQPDAIINETDQLSWGLSKGHGEAKVQEEAENLYLLCTDLIRIAVFNKDAIDIYNMNCMLGFQVVGKHITFYLTTLLCDALYVMAEVGHVDVPMSLEEIPAMLTSLDTLLITSNMFWDNCIVSTENKEQSRRNTLETPSFNEMVSKTRDRHRSCQLRF